MFVLYAFLTQGFEECSSVLGILAKVTLMEECVPKNKVNCLKRCLFFL